jgi:hypothetical protein
LAAILNVQADSMFDAALADPKIGLDQLKQSFRDALVEAMVRSPLPTRTDTAMSMLASLQVSVAPGPRQK